MIHGSKMRKGISLVEMLIAVVLFGVISSIGYKYYKNFYDVSLSAKQTRISAIIDQATQISNAYDLYTMKVGTAPTTMANLSANNIKILTGTPTKMDEITATGWEIKTDLELGGVTATNDIGFVYTLDAAGLSAADELEYCNILNNVASSAWNLTATYAAATAGSVGTNQDMYTTNSLTSFHCGGADATSLVLTFVKTYDAN